MRVRRTRNGFAVAWASPPQGDDGLAGLAVRFLINVAALWVAQALVRGFSIDGAGALLLGALIFGGLNAVIRPVVVVLSCPATCLTLGLVTLVINAFMLWLTAWVAGLIDLDFEVDGVVAALLGALIISLVSIPLSMWARGSILAPLRADGEGVDERW